MRVEPVPWWSALLPSSIAVVSTAECSEPAVSHAEARPEDVHVPRRLRRRRTCGVRLDVPCRESGLGRVGARHGVECRRARVRSTVVRVDRGVLGERDDSRRRGHEHHPEGRVHPTGFVRPGDGRRGRGGLPRRRDLDRRPGGERRPDERDRPSAFRGRRGRARPGRHGLLPEPRGSGTRRRVPPGGAPGGPRCRRRDLLRAAGRTGSDTGQFDGVRGRGEGGRLPPKR